MQRKPVFLAAMLAAFASVAAAAPATYRIDPDHTYPSFEADHLGGLSRWRGKFNHTSGMVTLDKSAGTGSVDITVDMNSADFGNDSLNKMAQGDALFETAKYRTATYRGRLAGFRDGKPTRVDGQLTLHGVTKPVELKIDTFKCMPHPALKREVCGADALATIQRDQFGISAGKDYGFDMGVVLRIQIEAIRAETGGGGGSMPAKPSAGQRRARP